MELKLPLRVCKKHGKLREVIRDSLSEWKHPSRTSTGVCPWQFVFSIFINSLSKGIKERFPSCTICAISFIQPVPRGHIARKRRLAAAAGACSPASTVLHGGLEQKKSGTLAMQNPDTFFLVSLVLLASISEARVRILNYLDTLEKWPEKNQNSSTAFQGPVNKSDELHRAWWGSALVSLKPWQEFCRRRKLIKMIQNYSVIVKREMTHWAVYEGVGLYDV